MGRKKSIVDALPTDIVFFVKRYIDDSQNCLLSENYDYLLEALYNLIEIDGFIYDDDGEEVLTDKGRVAQEMYDRVWLLKYKPSDKELGEIERYCKFLTKIKKFYDLQRKGIENPKIPEDYIYSERPTSSFLLRTYLDALREMGEAEPQESESYEMKQINKKRRADYIRNQNERIEAHNKNVPKERLKRELPPTDLISEEEWEKLKKDIEEYKRLKERLNNNN